MAVRTIQAWAAREAPLRSGPGGIRRRFGDGFLGSGLTVQQRLQFLAHLEVRDLLGRNVDLLAGLRVAAHPRGAIPEAEASKAPDLDLLAVLEGVHDALERRFHDDPGLDLRDVELAGHDV